MSARILLVEDEAPFRELIARQLSKRGYDVRAVGSAEDALEDLHDADLAICDISLPGLSGIDLLRQLRARLPACQCIVLTGQGSIPTAIEAMKLGAYHYAEKPLKFKELELYVQGALEKSSLARENHDLKARLGRDDTPQLVGDAPPLREVRALVERVAATPAPVLIEGETGTGKDLVARSIHSSSGRARAPFVAINCGALTETLLENELFGHVAGAFTGATKEQRGLFEVADGGTLFIDEVAEMSLDIQKRFLRVLENGEFRRLGEATVRSADVRVVAATNRTLQDLVERHEFREDLYYRLNVLTIHTPPLRDHLEDLPQLVDALLDRVAARYGRRVQVGPDLLEAFSRYHWPGNVRELRNVLERALVLSKTDTLSLSDCPGFTPSAPAATTPPSDSSDLESLEAVERAHIARVLEACDGNKTEAAKRLDISLRSLYRKLEKF